VPTKQPKVLAQAPMSYEHVSYDGSYEPAAAIELPSTSRVA
jgi:hypothetical protein